MRYLEGFGLLVFMLLANGNGLPSAIVDTLKDSKAGILLVNGKQTSCGLGILDNKAAFVSADCLDVNNIHAKDLSPYEVLIDNGERHAIENITVSPTYDSKTKRDNVALLQYNSKTTSQPWYNTIGVGINILNTVKAYVGNYVKKLENSETATSWANPKVYNQTIADVNCNEYSPLYYRNQREMACNMELADSPANSVSKCNVPYQLVYAVINDKLYLAGFHSYTVLYKGSTACETDKQRSYYTYIDNYIAFAKSILGRDVSYQSADKDKPPQDDLSYSMIPPVKPQPVGTTVVGGDLYARQKDISSATNVSESSDGDSSTSDSGDSGEDGLSKGATIAVAVSCSVGGILIAVAAFFLARVWRSRISRGRNPYQETLAQEILADELRATMAPPPATGGNNGPPASSLPVYQEIEGHNNSQQPPHVPDSKA